ncbi:C-type isolectin Sp-CL4-like [Paralichthys olivaceus]|uniref:C-type isolectin Sp-CL4-like n=1 Tax=Paralichthys olivaceus TaxID=8255 RepID=UPI0037522355
MRPALVTVVLLLVMFMTDPVAGGLREMLIKKCEESPLESCGSGWYRLDSSRCVKRISTKATFDEAESFCQKEGGLLVSIRNEMDSTKLTCMVVIQSNMYQYWIGARRQEGTFQWLDGSGLVPYKRWFGALHQRQDCMEMMGFMYGRWSELPCSSRRPFVCQKAG